MQAAVSLEEKQKAEAFRRGVDQFNAHEFWEAHESWEIVWLSAPEPDKTFLQGIIQVSAGFHHYGENNLAGARSLLRRGLARLEKFPADYRGVRLEELRAGAREWLAALERETAGWPEAFPKILEASTPPQK
jgi:predicted metal-dependent hydrolase